MAETVTIGLRDAQVQQRKWNEEMERLLEEATKTEEAVRRATSGPSLQTWITGNADPLSLDFEQERREQATKLDLLKRLGRQFAGTGARVAV